MMLLRLLNPQGIAGLAAAAILASLLIAAKIDVRHWKKQSAQFEQLYRAETKGHAETIANYRLAAERARAADRANAERVRSAQSSISERIAYDFEARLTDARARASRLRDRPETATGRGGGGSASLPGLPLASAGPAEAPGQDRLPGVPHEVAISWGPHDPDRLIATEQALQLDALIRWVRAQAAVEPNHRIGE
jgi:hypothetical protein